MWPRVNGMRTMELGMPGEQRTLLNGYALAGEKVATAGLLVEYAEEGEELEHVGERMSLVDDENNELGVIEVTAVDVVPFAEVTWEFARSEGEGFTSIAHWREVHTDYWAKTGVTVDDRTEIVCIGFRLL
ncbi:hypothetical protein Afil01_63550 [Actinorhabdospora filicis]|uniref:ASCH domain-containing protein n=1 Tax=Actinorhabdospora filicis TaxID=1785913 RepID=A0A9W6WCY1_9ACTN|nr:ASCH domain-containing protein [Actinorhabdospora filicis]GLZ81548.1 hypothetical protein Afil01_63550 [Actinorhabdospora filicis]